MSSRLRTYAVRLLSGTSRWKLMFPRMIGSVVDAELLLLGPLFRTRRWSVDNTGPDGMDLVAEQILKLGVFLLCKMDRIDGWMDSPALYTMATTLVVGPRNTGCCNLKEQDHAVPADLQLCPAMSLTEVKYLSFFFIIHVSASDSVMFLTYCVLRLQTVKCVPEWRVLLSGL